MDTKNTGPSGSADNTRTIARNSFWYGIELFVMLGATFLTSVAVARVVGATRLANYQFVVWLTNVTIAVGALGLPATTRRYMAEYLNRGEAGIARATYLATLKFQAYFALGFSALALGLVLWLGDPRQLAVSVLLVAAMSPRIVAAIPSQANSAAEVMRRNTGPSLAGGIATTALTLIGLWAGWDLVGVAASVGVGNVLECGLKLYSVERWLGSAPRGKVSPELKRRMFTYSGQGLALMLLNIVVWDRSDMVILKAMNNDPRQITFFSVAFNLTERILMIPSSFGASLAATMMAQFGRGQARLKEMTVDGARYALLVSLPLLVGMACLSPLVPLLYRESFRPMVPTLTIVALLAIPKALVAAPTMLLQATEKQGFLIAWGCLCGVVDIGLDFLLTPRHGANGAAVANGAAQALAALGIWIYVRRTYGLDLRLGDSGRILVCGAAMAAGVLAFTRAVPGYGGMLGSIAIGAAIWVISLRVTAALKPEDASRFLAIGGQFPVALRPHWKRLIGWLAPANAMA
jgi:O-antigen/teichoic acid export membrane protein